MSAHVGARARPEVRRLLDAARIAVDMDTSVLTVHEDDVEVVLASSSRTGLGRDAVGRRTPLADTCCGQVLAGRLAPWVPDASADAVAAGLRAVRCSSFGSYVGAPLRSADGAVVGMLCCISRAPDPRVGPRSAAVLTSLALALVVELGLDAPAAGDRAPAAAQEGRPGERAVPAAGADGEPPPVSGVDHHRAVLALARAEDLDTTFEPVVELAGGGVRAWAPRCRPVDPALGDAVDAVRAAGRHGLAVEVELACLRAALEHQGRQPRGTALAVVTSSALLRRPGVVDLLVEHVPGGLWVGIHGGGRADAPLHEAARRLRAAGAVLAVDAAGSPSANLVDALRLRPHLVGVSAHALDGLAGAALRPGLVEALLAVTRSVRTRLVAHDVATPAQRAQLRDLGVPLGRGPAVGLARPFPRA